MIHYKDLKQNSKYVLLNSPNNNFVGVFERIEPYNDDVRFAIFIGQNGYLYKVPFLNLVSVIEISSLEAELL
jgi:hypothetical protein